MQTGHALCKDLVIFASIFTHVSNQITFISSRLFREKYNHLEASCRSRSYRCWGHFADLWKNSFLNQPWANRAFVMPLSKTNIAVVFLVGFVNYLEWAIVMTSIYPYILSVSSHWHFYVCKNNYKCNWIMENQYCKWNGLINSDQKLEVVSRA